MTKFTSIILIITLIFGCNYKKEKSRIYDISEYKNYHANIDRYVIIITFSTIVRSEYIILKQYAKDFEPKDIDKIPIFIEESRSKLELEKDEVIKNYEVKIKILEEI